METLDADSWMAPGSVDEILKRVHDPRLVGGASFIRFERMSVGIFFSSVEDVDFARRLKAHGLAHGLRYGTIYRHGVTTSCRKFDQFGDWYLFKNPALVRGIFSGKDRRAADAFYYDVDRYPHPRTHERPTMQVLIAGSGKLATELLRQLSTTGDTPITAWAERPPVPERALVVHAGSGRELDAIVAFCEASGSTLIELSTGSRIESMPVTFPVVLCPNTNVLMLKFMAMLAQCGPMFQGYDIQLTESHQATKTSVPGTAVSIAQALGLSPHAIQSVRDPATQTSQLHIPVADLARHAYHQVLIRDGACALTLETRVQGDAPYAHGVSQIVSAALSHTLQARLYSVMEFIEHGWI